MSVIAFGMKEIAEAGSNVLRLAKNRNSSVYYAVRYSDPFKRYADFEKDEDKLIEEVVSRLFWYFSVANKIAYALQYEEEPGIFTEKMPDYEGQKYMTPKDLRRQLGSFDYNLATNDGNRFLGEGWSTLFDRVRQAVNEDILRAQERQEAA